ncbi:MAG: translocation/assembly module TamB domain-containing protein [Gemmatimonadota bacterium]
MKAWLLRLRRFASWLVLMAGVVLFILLIVFTQTTAGRERVLREVLARVNGGIQGQIEVAGISSPGLLRGFTFRNVTIRGDDGRIFLQADSVRAGISGPALLRGDLVFTGVHLWRPEVRLERHSAQEKLNAVSIFTGDPPSEPSGAPPEPSSDTLSDTLPGDSIEDGSGPKRTILLRGAWLHQGSLDILLPLAPGRPSSDRILVEPGADGTPSLRRMSFRDIDLEFGQAVLRAPGQRGERFELRNLSFTGEVWPDPFRVTGAEGEIRREGGRLLATLRTLNLPNSQTRGRVDVRWGGGSGVQVAVQGEADPLALEDLSFIEDRLPRGNASGPFGFELTDDGVLLDFQDTELTSDQGRIRARGGLFFGREMGFRELAIEMSELDLAVTDPWVVDTLPLRGRMTGELTLAGTLEDLQIDGLVDFADQDSAGVMTADISGRTGFRGGFTASPLYLTLAPLEWGALASVSPAMTLRGSGAVRLVLTGSLGGDGLALDGDITHVPAGTRAPSSTAVTPAGMAVPASVGGASRLTVVGRVRRDSTDLFLDLTGDLSPLSLTTLRGSFPVLPFEGEYTGRVELRGPISDLEVAADLDTSGGPLSLTARFDARHVADSYTLEAEALEEFVLSDILPSLPEPTRFTGRISAVGRGFSLDALEGNATVVLGKGDVGRLRVDSAFLEARIQDGVLLLHELVAETGLGHLKGSGFFGVAATALPGELDVEIRSESLEALRPFLMEVPGRILEELSPYERDLLEFEGVDLDTLPKAAEVAVGGAVQGKVVLRGGFREFTGEGALDFQQLRFRTDYVESGALTFVAENFPGGAGRIQAQIRTDSVNIRSLGFLAGIAEVEFGKSDGRVRVMATRSPEEQYSAQGTYVLDSMGGGLVNLDEFTLQFDTAQWNLGGPASFAWSSDGYRVRDFQLIRPGSGSMRIRADGFLPLEGGGEGDFQLDVERLSLARLARIAQMETPLEGIIDFRGRMTGSTLRPRIVGTASGSDLRYGDFSLASLESDLSYQEERVSLDLTAYDDSEHFLSVRGSFPADLRLDPDGSRIPAGPVELRLSADSFPAATALAFLEAIEEVEGTLSGDLHFGGTTEDLEHSGDFYLAGGSAVFPALGIRHRGVEAHLVLRPDGVVEVNGSLRSEGTARISGTVTLADPLSDPQLNLTVDARNFLAVNRRDVQARLSGRVMITQSYRRPQVKGALTVEQGVLMVEELARSVEVVDLSDPAFFNVVDATLVTLRPIIQASQNPFLQNLRLDVDLTMAQDGWLRSRELNVEMAGELLVVWDRTERNLAFLGVLDAVRGVYSVFGRQFQVEEGTVSFPGTPGINPDLNIRAVNQVRTQDTGRLEIIATVGGSLLAPRVSLSSNQPFPIAESDLVSYLIFGQPSYALSSGQSQAANNAAEVFAGAGASLAVGLFSSELGSLLARDVGLDYLAITQGQGKDQTLGIQGLEGTVATTLVEIGQYLTDDIFAALYWRPFGGGGGTIEQSKLAALRLEFRLSDHWNLEGYFEDRLFRSPLFQAVSLAAERKWTYGFFLFREWGY